MDELKSVATAVMLIILLTACATTLSREDPIPLSIARKVSRLDNFTSRMQDLVPQMVISRIIISHSVTGSGQGQVGDVCSAIGLTKPGVEAALSEAQSETAKLNNSSVKSMAQFLDQVDSIAQSLGCSSFVANQP